MAAELHYMEAGDRYAALDSGISGYRPDSRATWIWGNRRNIVEYRPDFVFHFPGGVDREPDYPPPAYLA
jgi:hypothetical protein